MRIDDRPLRKANGSEVHAALRCRYEYRSEQLPSDTDLAAIACEGWELVSVVFRGADLCWFYFKRAVG